MVRRAASRERMVVIQLRRRRSLGADSLLTTADKCLQHLSHQVTDPALVRARHDGCHCAIELQGWDQVFIGITARVARSDLTVSSRHALQETNFNINVPQTILGPVIDIMRAEIKPHMPHPLSSFVLRHLECLPD